MNGADVNTSVVFTKTPMVQTGSLKIVITTTSVAVTYIKVKIGNEIRTFNGRYGDYSYVVATDIPVGTHDLNVLFINGENGGGSPTSSSGAFSPNIVTIQPRQTSEVFLHYTVE